MLSAGLGIPREGPAPAVGHDPDVHYRDVSGRGAVHPGRHGLRRRPAGTRPGQEAVRFCIQVLRSFPALILALLATFFLGIGSFAGTAAITVYTFAIMTRLTL